LRDREPGQLGQLVLDVCNELLVDVHNEEDNGYEVGHDNGLRVDRRAIGGQQPQDQPADKRYGKESPRKPYRQVADKCQSKNERHRANHRFCFNAHKPLCSWSGNSYLATPAKLTVAVCLLVATRLPVRTNMTQGSHRSFSITQNAKVDLPEPGGVGDDFNGLDSLAQDVYR